MAILVLFVKVNSNWHKIYLSQQHIFTKIEHWFVYVSVSSFWYVHFLWIIFVFLSQPEAIYLPLSNYSYHFLQFCSCGITNKMSVNIQWGEIWHWWLQLVRFIVESCLQNESYNLLSFDTPTNLKTQKISIFK